MRQLTDKEKKQIKTKIKRFDYIFETCNERVKHAREYAAISQVEMAKMLGVARQTYLDLETGKTPPKVDMLVKISIITNRNIEWLIFGEEHNEFRNIEKMTIHLDFLNKKFEAY